MFKLGCQSQPWTKKIIVRVTIFEILARLTLHVIAPRSDTPRDWLNLHVEPQRLDAVTADTNPREQSLEEGPWYLNLGTGYYPIEHPEVLRPTQAEMEGSGNPSKELGRATLEYLKLTKLPLNSLELNSCQEKPVHNEPSFLDGATCISAYLSFRKEHMTFSKDNNGKKRTQRLFEANEHLGIQEARYLDLHEKEVQFAKDLYDRIAKGPWSSWKLVRFQPVVVNAIRSIRLTLYRIRLLDNMCFPPLFQTLSARTDAQKDAFELLAYFWTELVFRTINDEEERQTLEAADPHKLVKQVSLQFVDKTNRGKSEQIALSWLVFAFWFTKEVPTISSTAYGKLKGTTSETGESTETIHDNLKTYLNDQTVDNALRAGIIPPDYHVIFKKPYVFRHLTVKALREQKQIA